MMDKAVDIVKAGAVFVADRLVLAVRDKDETVFVLPGGKLDPGETVLEALEREVLEEVGVKIGPESIQYLNKYYAFAAGDSKKRIRIDSYLIKSYEGALHACGEIEELRWVNSKTSGLEFGSILRDDIIPLLIERELID